MKNLLISCSGGETSTEMALYMANSVKYKDYNKVFVFANTSLEHPKTYEFLKKSLIDNGIPLYCIEGKYSLREGVGVDFNIVDFEKLNKTGLVFVRMILQMNKYDIKGVPNFAIPYSSSYLKERPINKFAKWYFGNKDYVTAIGFRLEDMPKRITWKEIEMLKDKKIFPMLSDFEIPFNKNRVIQALNNRGLILGLEKSLRNCLYCYKADIPSVCNAVRLDDRFVQLFSKLENKFGNNFFRDNLSMDDILKIIQSGVQMELFPRIEDGCVCKI